MADHQPPQFITQTESLDARIGRRGVDRSLRAPRPTTENSFDDDFSKDHASTVKRWLSFLLLFGAVLGLLAQEAAFASAPAIPMTETAIAAPGMSDECAEMMGIDKSQDKKSCAGLTLDCIAKMGCALPPAVVSPPTPPAAATHMPGLLDPLPIQRLNGRTFGPEPDPPLILG